MISAFMTSEKPMMAFKRRAQLVAHGGEELGLGAAGQVGAQIGRAQLQLALPVLGDVLDDAEGAHAPAHLVEIVVGMLDHPEDAAVRPDDAIGDGELALPLRKPFLQGRTHVVMVVRMDQACEKFRVGELQLVRRQPEQLDGGVRIGEAMLLPLAVGSSARLQCTSLAIRSAWL